MNRGNELLISYNVLHDGLFDCIHAFMELEYQQNGGASRGSRLGELTCFDVPFMDPEYVSDLCFVQEVSVSMASSGV